MSSMPFNFKMAQQALGPADRIQGQLLMPNVDLNNEARVYEVNKKYQVYLMEFGKQPEKQTPFEKLNDVIINKHEGLKKLYGMQGVDLQFSKLLVDPSRISPLLKALNDENLILRQEIDKISMDLVNFTYMIDQLLNENRAIQQHLQQRDREQHNFVESIEINKTEELQDYRFQVQQLQEENNLLVKHLEDTRQNGSEQYISELQQELNNSRELYDQINNNFEQAKQREESLARQLQLLQPRYSSSIDQVFELEQIRESLEDKLSKLSNQNLLLSNKLDINIREYAEKIHTQSIQIEQMQLHLETYKRDKHQNVIQVTELSSEIEDLRRERVTILKERDEFQQICDQLYVRGKDIKSQLEIEKIRLQNKSGKDKDSVNLFDSLTNEISRLEIEVIQYKKQYELLLQEKKQELDNQNLQSQRILENMKIRYTTSIQSLTDQNIQLEKQVKNTFLGQDVLNREIDILQMENQDLKQKMLDYQQLKRIIDGQQMELRQLKLDLQDQKLINSTQEEQLQNLNQDTQITIQKLQKEVQLLNKDINQLYQDNQYQQQLLQQSQIR